MWQDALIGIAGLVLGAALAAWWFMSRRGRDRDELAGARARAELLDQQAREALEELRTSQSRREAAEREAAILTEQGRSRQKQFDEQQRLLAEAEKNLTAVFESLGAKALRLNSEEFLKQAGEKLTPFKELLEKQQTAVKELETKRETAYATIDEKIKQIASSHEKLDLKTGELVAALRRPEQRGRWGELQLRNAVELAGMTEHCDFAAQVTVASDEGTQRPDMIVNLPGGGVIPIDSKVALDAYLDALQPGADRDGQMKRHARHVQEHVTRLADKRYWEQFERTPGVVVLFMPLESALAAALEIRPDLHAEAMSRHVLVATPTLLVAMLRAIAFGWQQEALAANARQIAEEGRNLYDRLATYTESFERIGLALASAAKSYNAAVGSLEARLLPSARKLKDLQAAGHDQEAIDSPPLVEIEVRPITAAELTSLPSGGGKQSGRPDQGL